MSMVLCLTDHLADSEAWTTHLHMRGHETAMSDVKSLTALKTDSWDRAGLL
ncbi:MAG: hypothetical protein RLZZ496_265, partial [Pseudomonadota bacterium]